ncbi:intradiol ring-cleavage dioxygenase [Marinomonas balearica]|uniref:Protocatechuate 3,4-dioxygenase beta subunit n=1 Tax=Marinomonas balearica TaxID=491947 RepID=A0A4R6M507_9GAMM|nr:intradiol ring-cleavage dioxygenase [Marinomonas balearica]TDO95825.1 protocatechuate 3,4-dioxygenase beta subunit [Marinomonas balearica]
MSNGKEISVETKKTGLKNTLLKRRQFVKALGLIPLASAVSGLGGCDGSGAGVDSSTTSSASSTWASGTTDLISVDYPSDTVFDSGSTCEVSLTQSTTEGPCYFQDATGEDISLGLSGLPMQLCLRLIDSNCEPLENYTIEVWHCDIDGIYSGDTSDSDDASHFNTGFCTNDEEDALASTWYRGQLVTDSSGRVNFKSCFPGWYRGRTVHIHVQITSEDQQTSLVTQFCFSDSLVTEIFTEHELYSSRGDQDTPLSGGTDTVFPDDGYDVFMLTTEQNSDNTMLAYGTLQLT